MFASNHWRNTLRYSSVAINGTMWLMIADFYRCVLLSRCMISFQSST